MAAVPVGPVPSNCDAVVTDYRQAKRRILIFDYDGTLVPIVSDPKDAVPSPQVLICLKTLSRDPRNDVWIISGRDKEFLQKHLAEAAPVVNLVAEHGCWVKRKAVKRQKKREWGSIISKEQYNGGWKEYGADWFKFLTTYFPGTHHEEKTCSVTWHYREIVLDEKTSAKLEFAEAITRRYVAKREDIEFLHGKKIFEIRPTVANKATGVRHAMLAHQGAYDFIWCAGDDKTDEDMFTWLVNEKKVNSRVFPAKLHTCVVGDLDRATTAAFKVAHPSDMLRVMERMMVMDINYPAKTSKGTDLAKPNEPTAVVDNENTSGTSGDTIEDNADERIAPTDNKPTCETSGDAMSEKGHKRKAETDDEDTSGFSGDTVLEQAENSTDK